MGASSDLKRLARMADLGEAVVAAVRSARVLDEAPVRVRSRKTKANGADTEAPKRRGRPKGSKNTVATEATIPPPPVEASVADDLTEEEFE